MKNQEFSVRHLNYTWVILVSGFLQIKPSANVELHKSLDVTCLMVQPSIVSKGKCQMSYYYKIKKNRSLSNETHLELI